LAAGGNDEVRGEKGAFGGGETEAGRRIWRGAAGDSGHYIFGIGREPLEI
jgi:hypothetical protein